tara:strand:- start:4350 stop:4679 length:330 start_codon:yes stop_codon:yes gene_type:complete
MKLEHLLKAFGNIDQIYEGIKNNIFKKEHIEAVAKVRWKECKECEHIDRRGSFCMAPGTQPCCKECGCSLGSKIRSLSGECPVGKWRALMPEEAEEELKENMGYKDEGG